MYVCVKEYEAYIRLWVNYPFPYPLSLIILYRPLFSLKEADSDQKIFSCKRGGGGFEMIVKRKVGGMMMMMMMREGEMNNMEEGE